MNDPINNWSSLSIFRFPMDLDVRCKATLIGAVFLIDYMFFEKEANKDNTGLNFS